MEDISNAEQLEKDLSDNLAGVTDNVSKGILKYRTNTIFMIFKRSSVPCDLAEKIHLKLSSIAESY